MNDKYGCAILLQTQNGKTQPENITINDSVLCSDNNYHKVSYIKKHKPTKLLSVRGFWFNRILVNPETKLLVTPRNNASMNNARYINAADLIGLKDYYICMLANTWNGVMDDAVYEGQYAWVPFSVVTTDIVESTYEIYTTDNAHVIINQCIF